MEKRKNKSMTVSKQRKKKKIYILLGGNTIDIYYILYILQRKSRRKYFNKRNDWTEKLKQGNEMPKYFIHKDINVIVKISYICPSSYRVGLGSAHVGLHKVHALSSAAIIHYETCTVLCYYEIRIKKGKIIQK